MLGFNRLDFNSLVSDRRDFNRLDFHSRDFIRLDFLKGVAPVGKGGISLYSHVERQDARDVLGGSVQLTVICENPSDTDYHRQRR